MEIMTLARSFYAKPTEPCLYSAESSHCRWRDSGYTQVKINNHLLEDQHTAKEKYKSHTAYTLQHLY